MRLAGAARGASVCKRWRRHVCRSGAGATPSQLAAQSAGESRSLRTPLGALLKTPPPKGGRADKRKGRPAQAEAALITVERSGWLRFLDLVAGAAVGAGCPAAADPLRRGQFDDLLGGFHRPSLSGPSIAGFATDTITMRVMVGACEYPQLRPRTFEWIAEP